MTYDWSAEDELKEKVFYILRAMGAGEQRAHPLRSSGIFQEELPPLYVRLSRGVPGSRLSSGHLSLTASLPLRGERGL